MAVEAIDKIIEAEKQADERKQAARDQADEEIAAARIDGDAFVQKAVAFAKEKANTEKANAQTAGEDVYHRIMDEYETLIEKEAAAAELNWHKAIESVRSEII